MPSYDIGPNAHLVVNIMQESPAVCPSCGNTEFFYKGQDVLESATYYVCERCGVDVVSMDPSRLESYAAAWLEHMGFIGACPGADRCQRKKP